MRGLIVDNFAGGGGASSGIEAAFGRPVDVAINHDPEAIAMHMANHPDTRHFCQSIHSIDPQPARNKTAIPAASSNNPDAVSCASWPRSTRGPVSESK